MEIRIKSMIIMITSSFRPIMIIMITILIEQRNINDDNSDKIKE